MSWLWSLLAFLLAFPAAADNTTVHPAMKTPSQLVAEPAPVTRPSYEPAPNEVSQRYLSIVQSRIGPLVTSEAEARATIEVQSAEIERMKKIISDLEQENTRLKSESKVSKK